MSKKKGSVFFEAETPDFIKMMQGIPRQPTVSDKHMTNDYKHRVDDKDDGEDDAPLVVVPSGISKEEASVFLGTSVQETSLDPGTVNDKVLETNSKKSNILQSNASRRADKKTPLKPTDCKKNKKKKEKAKKNLLSFDMD